jgi:hypothetical protein
VSYGGFYDDEGDPYWEYAPLTEVMSEVSRRSIAEFGYCPWDSYDPPYEPELTRMERLRWRLDELVHRVRGWFTPKPPAPDPDDIPF